MHKYKKGDRVKIKSELWYLLNKDNEGEINMFDEKDSYFCGKKCIVNCVYKNLVVVLLPNLYEKTIAIKCIRPCISLNYIICKVIKFVKSKLKSIDKKKAIIQAL